MKSKEEIIQIMAEAIRISNLQSCKLPCDLDNLCAAEAALNALCGASIETANMHSNDHQVNCEWLYNQLKQWGKNEA